ncbi:MAG: hypothetical protein WBC21_01605 [Minisyncoccales bacterium]
MSKILKYLLLGLLAFLLVILCYFFIGKAPQQKEITWGISFSQKHAKDLGLDWKETYLSSLDDLEVKNLRLITHWDLIEPKKDKYIFDDLEWQIKEAEKREIKIILVIGMKTPRWPECHIPDWAEGLNREEREKEILGLLKEIVLKYQNSNSIISWQIENEPFFEFGECPEIREDFLKQEIDLVKSLDPHTKRGQDAEGVKINEVSPRYGVGVDTNHRKIIITESGTGSFWFKGAELGDIVGISLYRKVWFHKPKIYVSYPSPAIFYWRKAQIIQRLFNKEVICAELQTEPWGPVLLYDLSLEEQKKTMDLERFRENIAFAEKTGLKEFYLWGVEWWFWLKTQQNQPEIWQEAKKLF